jgi:arginyl-tRNA synthetase
MLAQTRHALIALFQGAGAQLCAQQGVQVPSLTISLDRPKQADHGDLATALALQLAKPLKLPPREVAQRLADQVQSADAGRLLAGLEIAGPGFINLRLTAAAKFMVVGAVLEAGANFGAHQTGAGRPVMVEFVSANPTGPLHVGHGRQAALGDAMAQLLAANGWQVHREFYYNDAGAQIQNLAISTQARAKGKGPDDDGFPADGYRGDYIADIAADFLARATVQSARVSPVTASGEVDNLEDLRKFAVAYLRREQDADLQAFGVAFDHYFLESSLYTDGKVAQAVQLLSDAGKTFEEGGALWLRSTEYGDDKDRVMRKSDGTYTYFVPDVAYHISKWQRGFGKVINIQGSDHHGTIARVRAGLQAANVGIPKGYPDYVLHKMVTVMRGGQEVKISKRSGSYVTLRDLIEWSGGGVKGRDAVRFFLISRKADTEFVFDVDLALAQSDENPVYYVQYAHARICSVFERAQADHALLADRAAQQATSLAPLQAPREFALMARLAAFPDLVQSACEELAPHQIAFYLRDLAAELHSYYNAEKVLVDDAALRQARLVLLAAVAQVLRNGLAMIGVSAPERM